jgi:hypothetical protein
MSPAARWPAGWLLAARGWPGPPSAAATDESQCHCGPVPVHQFTASHSASGSGSHYWQSDSQWQCQWQCHWPGHRPGHCHWQWPSPPARRGGPAVPLPVAVGGPLGALWGGRLCPAVLPPVPVCQSLPAGGRDSGSHYCAEPPVALRQCHWQYTLAVPPLARQSLPLARLLATGHCLPLPVALPLL